MDSLLASYASSDDEADEVPPAAPARAPSSAATRGGEAGATPAASSSSSSFGGGGGGIFSSLPQPKPTPLFSSLPAPKPGPAFSTVPPPKTSTNPRRVVQYRPQPIRQPTGDSSDEEEDDAAKKRRAAAAEARPAVPAGSGPVSSFLPPPKHSLGLGVGSGAGARRSAIDTTAPERPSLGTAAPSSTVSSAEATERTETGAAADDDDSEDSGSEDDMPVPGQEDNDEQLGSDAGVVQQQQQGYDAGAGSTSAYEAYAWDPNYYAQYGTRYGWDPNGNVNYATGEQYATYGGEQGGGYAHPHGGEHVAGYASVATAPYGADYTGGYGHEAAATTTAFPPVQDPVLPPVMGRVGGKRGWNDMPTEIVEVNQEELMKNRPKQDKSKLTGLAFGPSYQPAPSAKGKPSKLHKRKHQIGSLYHDMKSKEMELAERRSKGILTKAETQAKYGW